MDLNLAAFAAMPLTTDPYPHLILPGFLNAESLAEAVVDFPKIDMGGAYPPEELSYGPGFGTLLDLFQGPAMRQAVEQKFDVDLTGRPSMVTIRGCARQKDGQIHRDATFKMVTLLLYLNDQWPSDGGRLRVLRSPDNIEDYTAEIPPQGGLLFAFRCTENGWHGHKPFVGPRRSIQMNFVVDETMRRRELARHRISSKVKKLQHFFGLGTVA